jgi:Kef-type K+ transport system membrane component KefB
MDLHTVLPSWPLSHHVFAAFGLLLLAGVIGGELVHRGFGCTRVVGYVLAGLLLGNSGLGLFDETLIEQAWIAVDVAIGLVLFELGRRLDLRWLGRDRWLLATSALECALSFALMFAVLLLFGVPKLQAAAAAAIGMSTSPATVMLVARENRAEGQITERALNLVALNCVIAVVALTMLLPWMHHQQRVGWIITLMHPLYLLGGSLLLAALACFAVLHLARWLGKRPAAQLGLMVAAILVTVGFAQMFKLSVLITLLALGLMVRNLDFRHDLLPVDLGRTGELFFVVLFVFGSAQLQLGELFTGGALALLYVLARFAGKSLGVLSLTLFSGVRPGSAGWLCLMLTPMSVLALAMVQGTARLYPDLGAQLSAIVLSAVLMLELAGALAVQYAVRASGEAVPEA